MKKINKITLLTTSLLVTSALPLVALIACGSTETPIESPKPGGPGAPGPIPFKPKDEKPKNPTPVTDPMQLDLKIGENTFTSETDAFYLMKNYYSGDVIDNEVENGSDGIVKLTPSTSVMLKAGDSIILVLNDDEADSLNATNFAEKLFVKNTSVAPGIKAAQATTNPNAWEKVETKASEKITVEYLLKLKEGKLADSMFGGLLESADFIEGTPTKDNVLGTLRSWLNAIKGKYSATNFDLLLKHFQVKLQDGEYKYIATDNSTLDFNHLPMREAPIADNLFTYKQIAKNAIQFTYNGTQQSMTGLNFVLKNREGSYETLLKAIVAGEKEYSKEKYSKDNDAEADKKLNFVGSYNATLNTQKGKSSAEIAAAEATTDEADAATEDASSEG